MKTVKVTSKGQVTLPREIRDKLNIEAGMYLDATLFQGGILLKPVKDSNQLFQEYCAQYRSDSNSLEDARRILSKISFSLSEQSTALRKE